MSADPCVAERKKTKKRHLQEQRRGRNENPRNFQKNPSDLTGATKALTQFSN